MIENNSEYERMANVEMWHWWFKSLHEKTISRLWNNFNRNSFVVDCGCGTGGLLYKLHELGFNNTLGIDINDYAVKTCLNKKLNAVKGDIQQLNSYINNKVDAFVFHDSLCYFSEIEIHKILYSTLPLLKPNGVLLINLPAFHFLNGRHDLQTGIKKRYTFREFEKIIPREFTYNYTYRHGLLLPFVFFHRKLFRNTVKSDLYSNGKYTDNLLYYSGKTIGKINAILPFGTSLYVQLKLK